MNKTDLNNAVAERTGMAKKDVDAVLDALFGTQGKEPTNGVIIDAVASGDSVNLVGFGIFEQAYRNARKGRNPHSGEDIKVAARIAPKFKSGSRFKQAMPTP